MNTVQPPTADLRAHYRRLMNSTRWLGVGMCWTAVVPGDGRALTLDQVAARLAGNTPHQLHEPATLDAVGPPERDTYPVFADRVGSATVLFEWDHLGASPAVLRRLSEGARVYSVWWNVNAGNLPRGHRPHHRGAADRRVAGTGASLRDGPHARRDPLTPER
ncbi:hypothetical protein ACWDA3_28010 [Nonomuraea rubra]